MKQKIFLHIKKNLFISLHYPTITTKLHKLLDVSLGTFNFSRQPKKQNRALTHITLALILPKFWNGHSNSSET